MAVFVDVDFDSVIIRDTIHHGRLSLGECAVLFAPWRTCETATINDVRLSSYPRRLVAGQEEDHVGNDPVGYGTSPVALHRVDSRRAGSPRPLDRGRPMTT